MRVPFPRSLALAVALALASPALALDLNDYRVQNHRPRLTMSSELSGIASSKARELAGKGRLDHRPGSRCEGRASFRAGRERFGSFVYDRWGARERPGGKSQTQRSPQRRRAVDW